MWKDCHPVKGKRRKKKQYRSSKASHITCVSRSLFLSLSLSLSEDIDYFSHVLVAKASYFSHFKASYISSSRPPCCLFLSLKTSDCFSHPLQEERTERKAARRKRGAQKTTIAHEKKKRSRQKKENSSADAEEEESGDGVARQRMCG